MDDTLQIIVKDYPLILHLINTLSNFARNLFVIPELLIIATFVVLTIVTSFSYGENRV